MIKRIIKIIKPIDVLLKEGAIEKHYGYRSSDLPYKAYAIRKETGRTATIFFNKEMVKKAGERIEVSITNTFVEDQLTEKVYEGIRFIYLNKWLTDEGDFAILPTKRWKECIK